MLRRKSALECMLLVLASTLVASDQNGTTEMPLSRPSTLLRPGPCTSRNGCSNETENATEGQVALREEIWVVPLLVLSSFNVLLLVLFEVYVAVKTFRTTPSRRHLFLGQTLLLGLFLSSAMGFVFAMKPHNVTCAVIRLGLGLSYAVVFVTLLVKLVFLISLNSGVYLPANYQSLLVCFGIGIQLAIGVQWIVQQPPGVAIHLNVMICQTKFEVLLLALIYDILLLFTVTVLSIKCRTIRDNHREATFIGASIGFTILIWIGWLVAAVVLDRRLRDACVAFGLVGNATITFLVMFMPKGRQLAAMGEEGMYLEERCSRMSSRSSAATPSFFHVKPRNESAFNRHHEKSIKPSLYERVVYAPTSGRMLRYFYPPPATTPITDYYDAPPQPTEPHIYYQHLERPRMASTSINPNVHFYRTRAF